MIEELLQKPYWVVDFLPRQVPAGGSGRFFAVEEYYLNGPQGAELRRKFADILLKLSCYYDLLYFPGAGDESTKAPAPEAVFNWMAAENTALNVLLESEHTLIAYTSGSTNMTVYDPAADVLTLLRQLAAANGLFVWQP